jgi:hypothetical protein
MTTKGNFKDVPIGHEIKMGSLVGIKKDASHCLIRYATGKQLMRYVSPAQWVEYNPSYPKLNRVDTKIR